MNGNNLKDRVNTAARIRQIREDAGLTQEAFAELIGLSLSGYKKIESAENQISLNNLRKLSRALQVSTDYILLGKKEEYGTVWDQIMNYPDSDKMFLLIKLLFYFSGTKNSAFYLREEQGSIDRTILRVMESLKEYNEK